MRGKRIGRNGYVVAMLLGTLSAVGAPRSAYADFTGADGAINEISRYCTACWRNARVHPDRWSDCTQQVFARLLERVPPSNWSRSLHADGDERREFIRAIDAVKKRSRRARTYSGLPEGGVADPQPRDERELADEREAVRAAALELLSERQRQILQLSFEGWAVHEIAEDLELPEPRVSDEKYKAIRKLRQHFASAEAC